ncbi:MAG: hypothetical protein HQK52_15745 [Oligoflexia bacterium]|nr:hypothetical protein [Oligoflexia bacterium]
MKLFLYFLIFLLLYSLSILPIHVFAAPIEISSKTVDSSCSQELMTKGESVFIYDNEDPQKIIGNIKCKDDGIMGRVVYVYEESSAHRSLMFSGTYLQSLVISADSVAVKDATFPHSLKIKGKQLLLSGNNIAPVNFEIKVENFILEPGKIIVKKMNIQSSFFYSNMEVEGDLIVIKSGELTLKEKSIISSKNELTLMASKKLLADGIVRSNNDISITAKSSEMSKKFKIFSNGVYRLNNDERLIDKSTVVARLGASYWARTADLQSGFYFAGEVFSLVADSVNINNGTIFSLGRACISTRDEKMAKVQYGGIVLSSSIMSTTSGLNESLKSLSSSGWFTIPKETNIKSNTSEFKNIKGVQFISHNDLDTDKVSLISSEKDTLLSAGKKLNIQGKICTSGNSGNVILKALQASIETKISSAQGILIEVSTKLDLDSELMANQYITLTATDIVSNKTNILSAGDNISITSVGGGSIALDGTSSSGKSTIVTAEGRIEVHGSHETKGRMEMTSSKDKVVIEKDSKITYETGRFTGARGVEFNGTRSGTSEIIDSPMVKENGKVMVASTTYVHPDSEISFAGSFKESKTLNIVNAKKVEFIKGSDVKSDLIKIKSTNLDIAKDSSVEGDRVDFSSDFAKIEGALNSLALLTFNGKELKLGNGGMITGKGDILITGDLVELKEKSAIKADQDLHIYATDKIHTASGSQLNAAGTTVVSGTHTTIGGEIKGGAGTIIGGDILNAAGTSVGKLQDLTLANNSDVEGNFVQIQVAGAFSSDGIIKATGTPLAAETPSNNGNVIIKLESDRGKNIRGSLKANGWVMMDGKMDSDAIAALVIDRQDSIQAQGLSVVTTEPIIIQKNINAKHGLRLSGSTVDLEKDISITADGDLDLTATDGHVDLELGSAIKATKSVQIVAKGDIVRHGEELDDRSIAISAIESGGDILILSTDGSYQDTAASTRATGKIVIQTKKGIVITPIQQVFVSQSSHRSWYGRTTTTTTTRTTYAGAKMDASEVYMDSGEGKMDISNLQVNGKKLLIEGTKLSDEHVYIKFPEQMISIDYLEDTVQSSSKHSYSGIMKPFVGVVGGIAKASEHGKKITHKVLKAGEKILREASKPITKNIKGSEKYLDRFMSLMYTEVNFLWDINNPKKFYKVGTYKEQYDGMKTVAIELIQDTVTLEKKLTKKINKEVLSKISKDLARMVDDTVKIQDKGIHYLDAAASFENVARTALIGFASACGSGPAGAALANLIADRFIEKKTLTLQSFTQSVIVGATAGYVAEQVQMCSALGKGATFASHLAQGTVNDAGDIILNDKSYTSADFIAMALRAGMASTISIKNGGQASVPKIIATGSVRSALTSGTNELINEAVIEHHVDLRDVGDAALRGAANGLVNTAVTEGTKRSYNNIPERYKLANLMSKEDRERLNGRLDYYFIEQNLAGLEQGLKALAEGLSTLEEEEKKIPEKETSPKDQPSSSLNPDTSEGRHEKSYNFSDRLKEVDSMFAGKLKLDNDPINFYNPDLLDRYGFLQTSPVDPSLRKFIDGDLRNFDSQSSVRLKMHINSWDSKKTTNKQKQVLSQLENLNRTYSEFSTIPSVYSDYAEWLDLGKIIMSYGSHATTDAAVLLSKKQETTTSTIDELLAKGQEALDKTQQLLDYWKGHSDRFSDTTREMHDRGYFAATGVACGAGAVACGGTAIAAGGLLAATGGTTAPITLPAAINACTVEFVPCMGAVGMLLGNYAVAMSGGSGGSNNSDKENRNDERDKKEDSSGVKAESEVNKYAPTAKHGPGGFGSQNPIQDIETGQKLLDTSIASELKKQRFNIYDGKIIKFQPEGTGSWHSYELNEKIKQQVPIDVLKEMLKKNMITNAQYKKFLGQ